MPRQKTDSWYLALVSQFQIIGAATGTFLRERRNYVHVGSPPECRITTSLLRSVPQKIPMSAPP